MQHPFLVKRIVAIAGDEVQGRAGALYVNGDKIEEPYTDTLIEDGDFGPTRVGQGHVFVMGDNRHEAASGDSRRFGAVPIGLIQGTGRICDMAIRDGREALKLKDDERRER